MLTPRYRHYLHSTGYSVSPVTPVVVTQQCRKIRIIVAVYLEFVPDFCLCVCLTLALAQVSLAYRRRIVCNEKYFDVN